MQEELVSFQVAKLAKEKGFNIFTGKAWIKKEGQELFFVPVYTGVTNGVDYHAPTQVLLQRWLREVHDINITILICGADYHQYILHDKGRKYIKTVDNPITYENHKNNWEDTLEKGLQEALTLITIENEKT